MFRLDLLQRLLPSLLHLDPLQFSVSDFFSLVVVAGPQKFLLVRDLLLVVAQFFSRVAGGPVSEVVRHRVLLQVEFVISFVEVLHFLHDVRPHFSNFAHIRVGLLHLREQFLNLIISYPRVAHNSRLTSAYRSLAAAPARSLKCL